MHKCPACGADQQPARQPNRNAPVSVATPAQQAGDGRPRHKAWSRRQCKRGHGARGRCRAAAQRGDQQGGLQQPTGQGHQCHTRSSPPNVTVSRWANDRTCVDGRGSPDPMRLFATQQHRTAQRNGRHMGQRPDRPKNMSPQGPGSTCSNAAGQRGQHRTCQAVGQKPACQQCWPSGSEAGTERPAHEAAMPCACQAHQARRDDQHQVMRRHGNGRQIREMA